MKRSLLLFASTVGLLALTGAQASASPSSTPEVKWTYNFTPTQSFVQADAPGTGTVSFTNEPNNHATNTSDVVLTNLRVSSTAPSSSPDVLNNNGAWHINLKLTDNGSGDSTSMMFSGKLGGSFASSFSKVTNHFTGQTTQTWTDAKTGDVFTVSLSSYTPPGPPTDTNAGSISAQVSVTPGGGTISGGSQPEPSTLVLSCLGLSFAGFSTWRKRRAAALATA
jgi:hypothetical protein